MNGVEVAAGVRVPVPAEGELWVVGAVVLDPAGRAFVQLRGPVRRLFPDTWDIVGGHVEAGETVLGALAREVREETGWVLRRVVRGLGVGAWEAGGLLRHSVDFVVEVDGDLERPALEWDKHPRFAWVGVEDLPVLLVNREPGDTVIHDIVAAALRPPG
ncbi:NUDIX hydrolase [Actinokineospora guangxiensis]|uniref:NUDIX hydrolase n=1 Tax=Actinokineospora guangxiensis TaxID=1490288 RepID=A0ABW0EJD0_9PSEU